MSHILLTYDVGQNAQKEVKAALVARGFTDTMTSTQKTKYNLPNTTLYKAQDNYTSCNARDEIKEVIAELNNKKFAKTPIKLERCFVVEFSKLCGITGDEHATT